MWCVIFCTERRQNDKTKSEKEKHTKKTRFTSARARNELIRRPGESGQQARSCSPSVVAFRKLSLSRLMLDGRYKVCELVLLLLDCKMRTEKCGSPSLRRTGSPPVGEKKGLGRDGSLEANGLMLARKSANRKSGSYGFPEGEQFSHAVARW